MIDGKSEQIIESCNFNLIALPKNNEKSCTLG